MQQNLERLKNQGSSIAIGFVQGLVGFSRVWYDLVNRVYRVYDVLVDFISCVPSNICDQRGLEAFSRV